MQSIRKYPRTRHVEGSRLQPGDHDLAAVPFAELAGRHLVIEEKMDGANCGVSFSAQSELLLQSRGHYLTGGHRERHFDLLKRWAWTWRDRLWEVLGDRYVLYGEWLRAKHTVFYDRLPHYFLEFDVLDTVDDAFLDTPTRHELLADLPIVSVRVLHEGAVDRIERLTEHLGSSVFISAEHRERLREHVASLDLDVDRVLSETDPSPLMEGLYIKTEEGGRVTGRFKYVRADFLTVVRESESHWLSRPIVPNLLADGVDLFSQLRR